MRFLIYLLLIPITIGQLFCQNSFERIQLDAGFIILHTNKYESFELSYQKSRTKSKWYKIFEIKHFNIKNCETEFDKSTYYKFAAGLGLGNYHKRKFLRARRRFEITTGAYYEFDPKLPEKAYHYANPTNTYGLYLCPSNTFSYEINKKLDLYYKISVLIHGGLYNSTNYYLFYLPEQKLEFDGFDFDLNYMINLGITYKLE